MSTITAGQVKELRDRTGIAMMKCKQALEECGGDMDQAVEHLRKLGLETADKKAGRATETGALGVAVDGGSGAMVLIACETDFVGKNVEFRSFADQVAKAAISSGATDVDALAQADCDGTPVQDALAQMIAKIGENMKLSAVELLSGDVVACYNHGGRVATLVAGSGDAETLHMVAMHVAASNPAPLALNRDGVPGEIIEKEREIIAASPEVASKPEEIQPKIIEGKLNRFYKEHVLLDQEMLGDPNAQNAGSVDKWAKDKGVTLSGFARMSV